MPTVSILIAARNEEANILATLKAIDNLDYPKTDLEILIGNDDSEDNTEKIVSNFIVQKPHFKLFTINHNLPNLKGKANVLAQLTRQSTGDFLFFTDADTVVPPTWVNSILPQFKENVGVVTGITTMSGSKPLAQFQALEWLLALSIIRFLSLFNKPLTGMGNNMAVSRIAYNKIGGYEKVGFSIVEDYAIFKAIVNEGFRFIQLFDRRVLAFTLPIPDFKQLMIQRKRWVIGAMSLTLKHRINFVVNGLLLPIILIGFILNWKITLFFVTLHYVLISGILAGAVSWLNLFFIVLPVFWFYHIIINFLMLFNYLLVKETVWKGRKY